jgi:hypothetical protein
VIGREYFAVPKTAPKAEEVKEGENPQIAAPTASGGPDPLAEASATRGLAVAAPAMSSDDLYDF